jgi:hypothetical protein
LREGRLIERITQQHAADRCGISQLVRDTRRNRALLHELEPLFAARFPGRSSDWLAALGSPTTDIPGADGLLWSDGHGRVHRSHLRGR